MSCPSQSSPKLIRRKGAREQWVQQILAASQEAVGLMEKQGGAVGNALD